MMDPLNLIVTKRDGDTVSPEDLRGLIAAYTSGDVPDYQMSAFLMAAFLRGLDAKEAAALTDSMLYSGRVLDLSGVPGIKVDKHSTGGVGDKVSLILAPVVAACGVPVPMISGRGLGHTGGTLDKLESIPGFNVALTTREYVAQLERLGIVMIGQTDEIAPADRKLYALRDVTGTVESIPLIASSIMSKKLAEGIDALVLDVKCGRGAFMKRVDDARHLAETLVAIGEKFGKRTVALLTRMDDPLGNAVGNWPEVVESIRCLQGEDMPDVMEVTLALAGEMVHLGGKADSPEAGRARAQEVIDSGKAFETFEMLVEAQGGDASVLRAPEDRVAGYEYDVMATDEACGYVSGIDSHAVGIAAVRLGAGRRAKEDAVDPLAGILLNKKPGALVQPGERLAQLFAGEAKDGAAISRDVLNAFTFSETPPPHSSRLMGRLTPEGWESN